MYKNPRFWEEEHTDICTYYFDTLTVASIKTSIISELTVINKQVCFSGKYIESNSYKMKLVLRDSTKFSVANKTSQ